jgi:uncharacterized protein (UPF0264 family)
MRAEALPTPGLLVSVRSPAEAEAALAGGADLIDIKEPSRGALGRADDPTIDAVLKVVAGRRPVSAALGELSDGTPFRLDSRLDFVKWGLAGFNSAAHRRAGGPSWQERLASELSREHKPQAVVVAYADWQCAEAPRLDEVVDFACARSGNVLLIDTHCKEPGKLTSDRRPTLLDWLTPAEVNAVCQRCRAAGVRIALAGSLGVTEIEQLRGAAPAWFAVRGAVCERGHRQGEVQADRVRRLAERLRSPA